MSQQSSLNLKNILCEIDEARIPELRTLLDEFFAQDIAEQYYDLEEQESQLLFDVLSYQQGAAVLVELEYQEVLELFNHLSDDQIIKFANHMDLDDAADIVGLLEDERMYRVLERVQKPYELKELLSYDADSCGGIMSPHFISVRSDLKIKSALRFVRMKAKEIRNQIVYIYVIKKFGELAGVMSLRDLFLAPDDAAIADHMNTDVISVNITDDQELAADLISKYHFLSIPVVNETSQLMGIITIDDVVDVIEEEATEDIYQSSGINVESESNVSATESMLGNYGGAYKARTPWLIITLLGQYLAAMLIAKFDSTISAIPIAISFMPLLSGLSGNIGNQSMTIIVRGLSTGEVDMDEGYPILVHEVLLSIAIGITCALVTGLMSYFVYHNDLLSILIGSSLIASMVLAVSLGTVTPFLFKKLDIDPAAASGPLITTIIDMLSFFVYLTLITRFVKALV